MAKSDFDTIVIGGGAAGIAAARRLTGAGIDCLLVEARERLGGRAYTDIVDGYALDLGCGWLHSADRNPWVAVAEAQGRALDKTAPPWTRPALQAGFSMDEQAAFRAASEAFFERVEKAAQGPDRAALEFLEPGNRWNGLIGAIVTYITGGNLDQVSVQDFDNYHDTEVNWRIADGYGTLVAAHADGVPVARGCAVTTIDHSGKRLKVTTARGALTADHAIVAVPATLIADGALTFTPALPDKTAAAAGLPLGLADKLFVTLDRPEDFAPGTRLVGNTDSSATATYHFRPFGRPLIEVYFGGRNAHALEEGGARAFFDFAKTELTGLLGGDFGKRIAPLRMHPWASDPFARGSYSFALTGHAGDRAILAAPVDGRLFFAGEACSPHNFSTAHGAYESGVAAADAIIEARAGAKAS